MKRAIATDELETVVLTVLGEMPFVVDALDVYESWWAEPVLKPGREWVTWAWSLVGRPWPGKSLVRGG